ncbi:metallophosphoesterase [Methanoculleus taiwanensis]|uniref:metallophosphoesterase n=1 Tax=Methanoculleus taiwanensis TaxID=1550565 RepID=UPI001F4F21B5|nr:metallophosphoesterase [Methanoculleus taiwanensis]
MKLSRHNLQYLGLFALVFLPSMFGYMAWEAQETDVTVLSVEGGPEGVIFISDPHLKESNIGHVQRTIEEINRLDPSLVLIGGDFVNGDESDFSLQAVWSAVDAPVYAVLGNHDYRAGTDAGGGFAKTIALAGLELTAEEYDVSALRGDESDLRFADELRATLEANGVNVLQNEYKILRVGEKDLVLVGVDDVWAGMAEPPEVPETDAFTLYLIHVPDGRANWDADLILSGHTHGGQFMFPVVQQFSDFGFMEVRGLIQKDGTPATYITRGICGSSLGGIDLRFNSRPEIVLINPTDEQLRLLDAKTGTVTVG